MELYRKAGATLVPVELPELPAAAIYAILNAEAGAMFDELVRTGRINELADKGPNGRANQLRASRFIPAVEYIRAQRVRTLLIQQMNALFDSVDVSSRPSHSDSVTMSNLTGHPAVVFPGGFVDESASRIDADREAVGRSDAACAPPLRSKRQPTGTTQHPDRQMSMLSGRHAWTRVLAANPNLHQPNRSCCGGRRPFRPTGACSDTPSTRRCRRHCARI